MRLLFKPISIFLGIMSARMADSAFQLLWSLIDDGQPPKPTTEAATMDKVLVAAVLEAGTQAAVGAFTARAAANTWNYLFGVWPGDKRSDD